MNKTLTIIAIILVIVAGIGAAVYFTTVNKNQVNIVYGVVTDVQKDTVAVDIDGDVYNFNIAQIEVEKDLVEGDTIKISYSGKLENNVKATEIKIIAEPTEEEPNTTNSTNTTSSENTSNETATKTNTTASTNTNTNTSTNTKDDDEKVYYMTGSITEINGQTLKLKAVIDGKIYTYNIKNANIEAKSLKVGETVRVIHKGNVKGKTDKTIDAEYIYNVSTTKVSNTVTGVVEDATMNSLVINANGKKYSFSTMTATKNLEGSGIVVGETLKITYQGTLTDSKTMKATKIEK